jgi:hypothetical protein
MHTSSDIAHTIVVMLYMDMSSDVAHAIVVTSYMDMSSDVAHATVVTAYLDTVCHLMQHMLLWLRHITYITTI